MHCLLVHRSCPSVAVAVRCASGSISASASARATVHQPTLRRAFSRSIACSRGALPVFVEPSSPTLASHLATLNAKVLLPLHLTKAQKKLVYAQQNRAKLEAEPVEITLGDVTLPLEHLDRNRLPNRFHTVREIVHLSETPNDWENVVRLLEGFENAGLRTKPRWQELIVRRLCYAGMHHLLLKALQRVKATGLRLTEHGVVMQVVRGIHDKAARADWDREETTKALRMATQVTELMEDPEHHRRPPTADVASEWDHRRDPVVIALPTELAAVLAQRHGGDVAQVRKLANRLVTALQQGDYTTSLGFMADRFRLASDDVEKSIQINSVFAIRNDVSQLIIVWNALKTSRTVLGADMPIAAEAKTFETEAHRVLSNGIEALVKYNSHLGKGQEIEALEYAKDAVERCR
ncbi:hypothetical protein T440DRAFT_472785 [Plenodomus tracheiphilus IPT5]|uniref:Uncharacterized protein n=1 Tax=Plenodomus tracheiphilus IPT5 TaxID=1408161 RepID=A0A6A7AQD9_9PLEO|nr:hypothetical protein T440DRAFT_472785 [Plenodomus tracheiphilus IPT5]